MTDIRQDSGSPWSPRSDVTTLLCDADGTLFPSEDPAFEASAIVTRQLAERFELNGDFSAEGLRRSATGRNFRASAAALLDQAGIQARADELEEWIERENNAVTAHLSDVLTVDDDVMAAVTRLAERFNLAVVSSSARSRLDACFRATGLSEWFPACRRFSAEDSLTPPISKPDPAVYLHALAALDVAASQAIAVEDSAAGVTAAVAAGIAPVGMLVFVAAEERSDREAQLLGAGAVAVARTWAELVDILLPEACRC